MDKSSLNIPSYIEDPSYRYKMPRMILKIEGKGNGIKTNVVNLSEVSKALRVPTEYPLKFMGFEFGSLIIYKEKGNDITTIINGAFKDEQLQKSIDKFIEKYVLCPKCKYPEFVLRVRQGLVCGKCDSCGERAKCDNTHKFASYIVKNPPVTKGIKKDEVEEKVDKKIDKKAVPVVAAAPPKPKEEKPAKAIKKLELEDLTLDGEEIASKITIIRDIIKPQKLETGVFSDVEVSQTTLVKEIKDFNIAKGLDSQTVYILFQALFSIDIAFEVHNSAEVLSKTMMKLKVPRPELEILMNISYLLFKTYTEQDFTKFAPTILKHFYDAELLTEETLLQWGSDRLAVTEHILYEVERNKSFKEAAQPLINWLSTADEDEEEEEETTEEEEGAEKVTKDTVQEELTVQ